MLQCYSTEAVVDRCLDYIDPTNPIGICKCRHKAGRLAARGCVGEKQITLDLDDFWETQFSLLQHIIEVDEATKSSRGKHHISGSKSSL